MKQLIATLIFCLCSVAFSALDTPFNVNTYFVRTTGNDSTGDGLTPATAWATIDKALDTTGVANTAGEVDADTVIWVEAGTYTGAITCSVKGDYAKAVGTVEHSLRIWVIGYSVTYTSELVERGHLPSPTHADNDAWYRHHSDMSIGGEFYGGAEQAYREENSLPDIKPNGAWVIIDGNNAATVLDLQATKQISFENFYFQDSATGGTDEIVGIGGASIDISFRNCRFDDGFIAIKSTSGCEGVHVMDCYFGKNLAGDSCDIGSCSGALLLNNIFDSGNVEGTWATEVRHGSVMNNIFIDGVFAIRTWEGVVFTGNTLYQDNSNASGAIFAFDSNEGFAWAWNNNYVLKDQADDAYRMAGSGGHSEPVFSECNVLWSLAGQVSSVSSAGFLGVQEKDPIFESTTIFRLRPTSPGINTGLETLFGGNTTIGAWLPYAVTRYPRRSRYAGIPIYNN